MLEDLFAQSIYGLSQSEKELQLLAVLNQLEQHHQDNCGPYKAIRTAEHSHKTAATLAELPFLPVRLFKSHLLESIPADLSLIHI